MRDENEEKRDEEHEKNEEGRRRRNSRKRREVKCRVIRSKNRGRIRSTRADFHRDRKLSGVQADLTGNLQRTTQERD